MPASASVLAGVRAPQVAAVEELQAAVDAEVVPPSVFAHDAVPVHGTSQ